MQDREGPSPAPFAVSRLLGLPIHAPSRAELLEVLLSWSQQEHPRRIYCLSAAAVLEAQRSVRTLGILSRADLNLAADPALRWAAALGGVSPLPVHDPESWLGELLERLRVVKARITYIGGPAAAGEAWRAEVLERFPGLSIQTQSADFEKWGPENDRVLRNVVRFKPTLVLAGLGSPAQEEYLHAHAALFHAPLCISVGPLAEKQTGIWPEGPISHGPLAGVGKHLDGGIRRGVAHLSTPGLLLRAWRERLRQGGEGGSAR